MAAGSRGDRGREAHQPDWWEVVVGPHGDDVHANVLKSWSVEGPTKWSVERPVFDRGRLQASPGMASVDAAMAALGDSLKKATSIPSLAKLTVLEGLGFDDQKLELEEEERRPP